MPDCRELRFRQAASEKPEPVKRDSIKCEGNRMKIILRQMKPYGGPILIILVLLVIQAFCDLALPQYTSDIIDVGITNQGVSHILPEKITREDFETALLFMNEEETSAWSGSYTTSGEEADGSSAETGADSGAVLTRRAMKEAELDALDEQLQIPVLMNYLNMEYRPAVEAMIESMGSSLLSSMGAAYAAQCDERAGVDMDQLRMGYLWSVGRKMLLVAFLIMATSIAVGYIASGIGAAVGKNLRHDIFHKVIGFSNGEIEQFSTASLITRSTNDIQQIQMVVVLILRMVLYAPILGLGGIYKVVQTHARMEWIIILAVVLILLLVAVLMRIAMPKFRIMQKLIDALNMVSREILTGLPVIRAFGREEEEEKRFEEANRDLTWTQLFTSRIMVFMMPGMSIIMYGITLLIVWVAAGRIDGGTLQIGTMTAFITYSIMIVMSFLMLTVISIMLPRASVAAERIDEVLRTESSIRDPEEEERGYIDEEEGVVTFDHVSFRYPGAEEEVLSDISFTAKPGTVTAVIGSTGSGKSTLINLIPRFYDATGGSIRIDGVDIRDLPLKELRDRIGYVPQKGVLFSGTISSNLRFGDESADEEMMREAAGVAQALEFIDEKPEGFDSPIAQGGANVSGGQKQRLAIARALVRRPDIMIFDDSFSALDMKTDAILRKALSEQFEDCCVLIVAQRISTIMNADQILVLEDGRLTGRGTHAELLRECPVYREIAISQLPEDELEEV